MSLDSICSTHTVTVERSTMTVDASSGALRTNWTAVAGLTTLPCNIQPLSGKERLAFAQKQLLMTDRIYLSGDYTSLILRSDRLRDSTGRIFRIHFLGDAAGQSQLTKIEAQEFMP